MGAGLGPVPVVAAELASFVADACPHGERSLQWHVWRALDGRAQRSVDEAQPQRVRSKKFNPQALAAPALSSS